MVGSSTVQVSIDCSGISGQECLVGGETLVFFGVASGHDR